MPKIPKPLQQTLLKTFSSDQLQNMAFNTYRLLNTHPDKAAYTPDEWEEFISGPFLLLFIISDECMEWKKKQKEKRLSLQSLSNTRH